MSRGTRGVLYLRGDNVRQVERVFVYAVERKRERERVSERAVSQLAAPLTNNIILYIIGSPRLLIDPI